MGNDAFWIVGVSFLVAANCGLLGCFLLLRKQAMVGDALSHAVLPGLVIAFLLTNSYHPLVFVGGAVLAGIGATFLMEFCHRQIMVPPDVATGITFTFFFSIGIILVEYFTERTDLDQGCVLYGQLISVCFDRFCWHGWELGPKNFWILLLLLVIVTAFIVSCYRALLFTSFDTEVAKTMGIKAGRWHYALMVLTSIVTVFSFRVVGAPLVVAFLVVPPATAYLLTTTLTEMLWYTLIVGFIVALNGYHMAIWANVSLPGSMATVSGGLFAIVFLLRDWVRGGKIANS